MNSRIDELVARSIAPSSVRTDGSLTRPRTYGVYRISPVDRPMRSRRYRYGNHPVRLTELLAEFGSVSMVALFHERNLAVELAGLLNARGPGM